VRADIQGLRAIAVLLVLGFHLWPQQLTGGYVGVDVFLVISGFLITSHLLRAPPRSLRDVGDFWARRLRRLLPASLLVIVVTVIAGCLVLPVTRLADLGRDAGAATLYFVNWVLAASSVDYLGAESDPSPLQHYWSLSVEEQFYFLWPLLIAATLWVLARTKTRGRWSLVTVLVLFAGASLATSIIWTGVAPASAYFVTPTRLWELAAGGVLAAVIAARAAPTLVSPPVRAVAAWLGLGLIAVSAFLFTGETPFPGVAALLPIVGTLLVISARSDGGFSPTRVLALRPIQHLGDVSYSLYLWHWPLIVLLPFVIGGTLTIAWKLGIIVVAILLATATKLYIEDPVRRARWLSARLVRTYGLAAAGMAVAVAVAFIPIVQVTTIAAASQEQLEEAEEANVDCFGAAALGTDGCELRGTGIVPAPAVAIDDKSDAYLDECFAFPPFDDVATCSYGDPDAKYSIALVGNSHAGQWLPAMQEYVRTHDARVTTFLGSRCRPSSALIVFDTAAISQGCREWGERVVEATTDGQYDLVVLTVASNGELVGVPQSDFYEASVGGFVQPIEAWDEARQPVLLIRDTPIPGFKVPDCVAVNPAAVATCDGPRAEWLTPDPLVTAAEQVDGDHLTVADFSDRFCDAETCYSVLGGVLVYFDALHVSATFSATLAPFLSEEIDALLPGSP